MYFIRYVKSVPELLPLVKINLASRPNLASKDGGIFVLSVTANWSTSDMEQKYAGRSGVYYYLGVINPNAGRGKFISATVRIDVLPSLNGETPMLAAAPLSTYSFDRTISEGANVFDLVIQGYQPGSTASVEATKNFEYMLHMIILRGIEHMRRLPGPIRNEFAGTLTTLMRGLVMLSEDDFADAPVYYELIDKELAFSVQSRIMLPDGEIKKGRIPSKGLEVIQWLNNYAQDTSKVYVERLRDQLAAAV